MAIDAALPLTVTITLNGLELHVRLTEAVESSAFRILIGDEQSIHSAAESRINSDGPSWRGDVVISGSGAAPAWFSLQYSMILAHSPAAKLEPFLRRH